MLVMVTFVVVMFCAAIIELWVVVQVASWIGALPTILLMLASTVLGGWVIRREGLGAWRRGSQSVRAGEKPTHVLVDGALVLSSGILLIVPGLVTSAIGLLLAVPVLRSAVRPLVAKSLEQRVTRRITTVRISGAGAQAFGFGHGFGGAGWPGEGSNPAATGSRRHTDFIDLEGEEVIIDDTPHSIEPPGDRPR